MTNAVPSSLTLAGCEQAGKLRLHTSLVDSMDTAQAQRLMTLSDRLDSSSPKGNNVVSDDFQTI